jgi:hypothetical protein
MVKVGKILIVVLGAVAIAFLLFLLVKFIIHF